MAMTHQPTHKKYPSMFCKPKPMMSSTYLYQRKWLIHQQKLRAQCMNTDEDTEESEKPSMGGRAISFDTVDPLSLNQKLSIISTESCLNTTVEDIDIDDEKSMQFHNFASNKKAKSELIFIQRTLQKRKGAINPAAMLHSHYYKHYPLHFADNISCIHGHYAAHIQYKPKSLKLFDLSALMPPLLQQYRVIHCGYIRKRGKILRKWKKRFGLLLCAKMDDYYQFQLLYFDSDKLSKYKGVISFTNKSKIGLISPTDDTMSDRLSISASLDPEQEIKHSLNVSKSVPISRNTSDFYHLSQKHPICCHLENISSSFPSHCGFYITDTERDETWFIDTNNMENTQRWLQSIWDIDKQLCKRNLNEENVVFAEGFSDFVEVEMDGYNAKKERDNVLINKLKYMMIVPKWCCMRFKGILLFDCGYTDNENEKCFQPDFCKAPREILMKQQSLFVDHDKENGENTYFELVGDLRKCFCNARNRKAKLLWNTALQHYRKSVF